MNKGIKNTERIFFLQVAITTVITAGLFFIRNGNEALSALLGGLVAILPTLVFAKLLFRHRGAQAAKKIVNNFYLGEGCKIICSIVLFAFVFRFFRVAPIVFFVTYISVAMSFGFLLLIIDKKVKT